MAEEASKPESTHQPPPSPFVEVECKISKKKRRFAAGTKAGFAVSLINRKLDSGHPPLPLAFAIESVKDGEEPVSFGPDAPLVHYGNAWNLQAVTELDYPLPPPPPGGENLKVPPTATPENPFTTGEEDSYGSVPGRRRTAAKPAAISGVYIAKILLAFVLIFVLGSAFTIALENLPKLILLLNSFM